MPTLKKDPQSGFDEEIIENEELEKALEDWDQAEEEYQAAEVGKLTKARDDAKKAVVEMLPLGEQSQTFRAGEHTIDVTPPSKPTTSTRTPKHRATIKRVEEGKERG